MRSLNLVASLCGFGALINGVHVRLFQQIFEEDEETLQAQLTPCKVLETRSILAIRIRFYVIDLHTNPAPCIALFLSVVVCVLLT